MKIVKFSDGQFGVRKFCWLMGWRYLDLRQPCFWWGRDDKWFFTDCRGTRETANECYYRCTDKGTPVQ